MSEKTTNSRKLFLLRHGERVDNVFGSKWISTCFDQNDGYKSYSKDSPLTNIGLHQAHLLGEGFQEAHLNFEAVYCSPSYRCIQTCNSFLKACGKAHHPIKIEPGLYEWLNLDNLILPQWMSLEEIATIGYKIDLDYKPFFSVAKMKEIRQESCNDYYNRCEIVTKRALENTRNGNVLFVAHSTIFEYCTRDLIGKARRPVLDLAAAILTVPYCYFMQVEEKDNHWEINEKPLLQLMHLDNNDYDLKLLLD